MQIAPGLYSIGQKKGGNVHAYLIDDGGFLTLIDTLFDADASVVLAEIARTDKRAWNSPAIKTHHTAMVDLLRRDLGIS